MSSVEHRVPCPTLTSGLWLVPVAPRPVRAPYSPPRSRSVSGAKAAAARDWLCAALALEPDAHVEVTEWTACDSRGRAYTTAFVARDSSKTVAFAIFKEVDSLSRDDLFLAAESAVRVRRV